MKYIVPMPNILPQYKTASVAVEKLLTSVCKTDDDIIVLSNALKHEYDKSENVSWSMKSLLAQLLTNDIVENRTEYIIKLYYYANAFHPIIQSEAYRVFFERKIFSLDERPTCYDPYKTRYQVGLNSEDIFEVLSAKPQKQRVNETTVARKTFKI